MVTIEDNVRSGGFGTAVAEELMAHRVTTPQLILSMPDRFVPHANIDEIHADAHLTPEGVVAAVMGEVEAGRYRAIRGLEAG